MTRDRNSKDLTFATSFLCLYVLSPWKEIPKQNNSTEAGFVLIYSFRGWAPCLAGSSLFLCLWRGTGEWWEGVMEQGCLSNPKGMLRVSGHPCPLQRHSFTHPGPHLLIVCLPMNSIGKPTDKEDAFTIQSHLHKFTSWGLTGSTGDYLMDIVRKQPCVSQGKGALGGTRSTDIVNTCHCKYMTMSADLQLPKCEKYKYLFLKPPGCSFFLTVAWAD